MTNVLAFVCVRYARDFRDNVDELFRAAISSSFLASRTGNSFLPFLAGANMNADTRHQAIAIAAAIFVALDLASVKASVRLASL